MGFDWTSFKRCGWAVVEKDASMSKWIVTAKNLSSKK